MSLSLRDLTKEALDALTDHFSDKEISDSFGLSRTACTHKRNSLGVLSYAQKHKTRKYSKYSQVDSSRQRSFGFVKEGANEHYFDLIDSSTKAYWLGLIYADGWIITQNGDPTAFALALKGEDKYLLERFASDLGHQNMVRRTRPTADLYQVKLTSKHAANQLIKHGVIPSKSLSMRFPELDPSHYPYFIRGYFDGDGCAYVRKNSMSMKFTSGSREFLESLQQHLKEHAQVETRIRVDGNIKDLLFYAQNAFAFAKYIYVTSEAQDLFMSRKREKVFGFQGSGAGHSWGELLSNMDSLPSR